MRKVMTFASFLTAALPLLLIPRTAFPLVTQPSSTAAGGGGSASSANYAAVGVIAQPGAVGQSQSASFSAGHGLLAALGGWHLLYPVISATPGVLTFTLQSGASGSHPITLSNAGAGSLAWTVAKAKPAQSCFTISPSTGRGNATITVSANAAGLAAGSYSDTLTISAAGLAQTVKVQLFLTVSGAGVYRLTVSIASDTPLKGGGSVHSDSGGIACSNQGSAPAGMSGTCSATFSPGTTVTLMQTPDSHSTWATWSPAGCGTSASCQVVMNGDRQVAATFPYARAVKVNSSGTRFDSLSSALSNAAEADTVLARGITLTEDLLVTGKSIKLRGGLDAWYLPLNARTTLDGKLSIRGGKLTVDKLVIR